MRDIVFCGGGYSRWQDVKATLDPIRYQGVPITSFGNDIASDAINDLTHPSVTDAIKKLRDRLILNMNQGCPTFLFLHDFGGYIGLRALEEVPKNYHKAYLLSVFTFGSVCLIEKKWARVCTNLIYTDDILAKRRGQRLASQGLTLWYDSATPSRNDVAIKHLDPNRAELVPKGSWGELGSAERYHHLTRYFWDLKEESIRSQRWTTLGNRAKEYLMYLGVIVEILAQTAGSVGQSWRRGQIN